MLVDPQDKEAVAKVPPEWIEYGKELAARRGEEYRASMMAYITTAQIMSAWTLHHQCEVTMSMAQESMECIIGLAHICFKALGVPKSEHDEDFTRGLQIVSEIAEKMRVEMEAKEAAAPHGVH